MARDIKLHCEDTGAGAPPLLFVHGYLSRGTHWQPQTDHFRARHRVVSCDLRGHGQSAPGRRPPTIELLAEDVAALLEERKLTGAVLAGHSMGCRVVLEARRLAPGRVAGLVLVDGSNIGLGDKDGALRRLEAEIAAQGFEAFARKLVESMFVEGHDPALLEEIMACGLAVPESFAHPLFRSLIGYDAERALATMDACDGPVLVLQSTAMGIDRVRRSLAPGASSPYMELVRAHCPQAIVEVIPGAGHYVHLEAPAAVNARIEAFLAGLRG
jgi:pimeloyl-ACP methyl ester carboxylesterase